MSGLPKDTFFELKRCSKEYNKLPLQTLPLQNIGITNTRFIHGSVVSNHTHPTHTLLCPFRSNKSVQLFCEKICLLSKKTQKIKKVQHMRLKMRLVLKIVNPMGQSTNTQE